MFREASVALVALLRVVVTVLLLRFYERRWKVLATEQKKRKPKMEKKESSLEATKE